MKPRPGFVPPATAVPSCTAAAAPLRRTAVGLLAGLRLAGGYRVGCSTTPEAAPLAFSLPLSPSRQRRLLPLAGWAACCPPPSPPAALAASSATSRLACSLCSIAPRPSGGKSQAIEHNSALPKATAPSAAKLLPAWAAARPAGSGNGLLCLAPPAVQLRYLALRGCLSSAAHPWLTLNQWAALPRLRRARWPAAPGSQLVGAVTPRLTFGFRYPCPYTWQRAGFARHCPRKRLDRVRLACFPDCPAGAFPPDGGHDRKGLAR